MSKNARVSGLWHSSVYVSIPPVFYTWFIQLYLKIKSRTDMILLFLMKYIHIKRYLHVYWIYFHSCNNKNSDHTHYEPHNWTSLFHRFHEFSMIFHGFWLSYSNSEVHCAVHNVCDPNFCCWINENTFNKHVSIVLCVYISSEKIISYRYMI